MKASELMIGDWVFCTYPSIKKPSRVEEIRTVADNELRIIIIDDMLRLVFSERYIEPIPLTPEILEKNGTKPFEINKFKDVATGKWWSKGSDFYVKQYHFKHRNFQPTYSFGCQPHTLIEGIQFVHELQHALKLCGINKEIVL